MSTAHTGSGPGGGMGLSVWLAGQRSVAAQRGRRYVPAAAEHPAPMPPELAGYVISRYTRPGQWVLDPMCGIGTTLIEALHRGRHSVGIDSDPRWTEITRASIDRLRRAGIGGRASVITGDARQVDTLLSDELAGRVALLLTTPPHTLLSSPAQNAPDTDRKPRTGRGSDNTPTEVLDRGRYRRDLTGVLTSCRHWMTPGGHVVISTRPWRTSTGLLLDLPADTLAAGQRAGLVPIERCAVICGRVDHTGHVQPRTSRRHREFLTRLRASGVPALLHAHHDVFVFAVPDQPHLAQLPRPPRHRALVATPPTDPPRTAAALERTHA